MDTETVIIGGGLSGLALAAQLEAAGRDWRLLEARDRFGGRILSAPAPGDGAARFDLARFDLGPAWVWPGQPRVAALAHTLSLPIFDQHSDGATVFEDASGAVRRDLAFALNGDARRIDGGLGALVDGLVARLPQERLRLNASVHRIDKSAQGWRALIAQGDGLAAEEALNAASIALAAPPRVIAERIALDGAPQTARDALKRTPTWMAGHAKLVAVYDRPFWRDAGLSGDAISHRGPLAQIHDASPREDVSERGALFGFVGLDAQTRERLGPERLRDAAARQLGALFGPDAATPQAILLQDWSAEPFTAAPSDRAPLGGHPPYGPSAAIDALAAEGLVFAVSEFAPEHGGLVEGALAAAERAAAQLSGNAAAPRMEPETASPFTPS